MILALALWAMSKRPEAASLEDAFEFHVSPEPNCGCWLWTGPIFKLRGGYGCFTMRPLGVVQERAHRLAWSIYRKEPLTRETHVLHKCDNPVCVNPDHLFLGDQRTNMTDKVRKNRQDKGDIHGRHKLSEREAIAIRSDPRPYAEIATAFGVTVPTISDIKCARSWKHLGPPVGRYNRAA
ncbi:hypothetical protein FHW77_002851 [Agrobacterium sp. RC10-4-1]|nr:hypothetical protein [Agrobacterium sp. RC10-4-1]